MLHSGDLPTNPSWEWAACGAVETRQRLGPGLGSEHVQRGAGHDSRSPSRSRHGPALALLQSVSIPSPCSQGPTHRPVSGQRRAWPCQRGAGPLRAWQSHRIFELRFLAASVRSRIKPVQRLLESNRNSASSIGMPQPSPVCFWGLLEASFWFRGPTLADTCFVTFPPGKK